MSRTAMTLPRLSGFTGMGGMPLVQSLTKHCLNLTSSTSKPPAKVWTVHQIGILEKI
jgi:hypothetical protein